MMAFTGPRGRTIVTDFSDYTHAPQIKSVVSLHSHTLHSYEALDDLPRYIVQLPLVGRVFERELEAYARREGCSLDFSKGWWHPPVSAREVFESEARQIEERFELSPLVSVTDHDSITAGVELQALYAQRRAPISFEWTVPYGRGYFHLGVHNLPAASAAEWFARLAALTARPRADGIAQALADLDDVDDILVVFNHPMWDLADVGADEHALQLRSFLDDYRVWLHALELNGYRSRHENASVAPLSDQTGLPLISGGDRHGRDPNALLNLSGAQSFAEFASEVRHGISHVVVMPEYHRHLATRQLSAASDALRWYGTHPPGRQHWTDRISWATGDSVRPLSFHWPRGGPLWVRSTVSVFQWIASPMVLPLVRAALHAADNMVAPGFVPTEFSGRPRVRAVAGDIN